MLILRFLLMLGPHSEPSCVVEAPCAIAVFASDTLPLPDHITGPGYGTMVRFLQALRPREEVVAEPLARRLLDGLVVDETQTRIGQDFYDAFFGAWTLPEGAVNVTVRIQEQPSPTLGTRVVILLNDETLLQLQLPPRTDAVEDLGRQAAAYLEGEVRSRLTGDLPGAVRGGDGRP